MTGIAPAPPELRVSAAPESSSVRILRAGAQLAGTAILAGSIVTVLGWIIGLAIPLVFILVASYWMFVPPAAAVGGVMGGAALAVCRALGGGVRIERLVVPIAGALGSIPALLALAATIGDGLLGVWWLWVGVAALAAAFAHVRVLRHPLQEWRPVLVRLLFGLGLAIATVTVMVWGLAHFWASVFSTEPSAIAVFAPLVGLAVAGAIGLAALVISLGPFPSRTAAGLTWTGIGLLAATIAAVMLGVMLQSSMPATDAGPIAIEPTASSDDGAGFVPTTDEPREPMPEDVAPPSLEEGRAQFAAFAAATVEAAGPDATWSSDPVVQEFPCDGGGTMLLIDAEFTMGEITDTTTDEHDRAVTEANLAAADRIVLAWSAAGLGTPEVLHGEPILGGADVSAVDWAKVDFAFGVAQPRIEGRCLPVG